MKNKKLFAILTLVCFMFTLMPVAAFATTPYLTVESEDKTYTAEANETVTLAVTNPAAEGYWFFALDGEGDVVGRLPLNTTTAASYEFDVTNYAGGTYDVYAVKADTQVTNVLNGSARYADKVDTLFEDHGALVLDSVKLKVKGAETTYSIKLEWTDGVDGAQSIAANSATGGDLDIVANNGWTGGVVTATVYKNGSTPVKDAKLSFSTVGFVTATAIDAQTDRSGQAMFKVSATKAGDYQVYVTYGDCTKVLPVDVAPNGVAGVSVVKAPTAPVALGSKIDVADVQFKFTDANGTGNNAAADRLLVAAGDMTGNYTLNIVAQPADSDLDATTDFALDASGKLVTNNNSTFTEEGNYTFMVTLENGVSAKATVTVKKFDKAVGIAFDKTVATKVVYDKTVDFDTDKVYAVDANGVTKDITGVKLSVAGKAVFSFVQDAQDATKYTLKAKDEDFIGQKITLYAVYTDATTGKTFTASREVVVMDDAAAIVYNVGEAEVGVNNVFYANVFDADGNKVDLTNANPIFDQIVLEKPENAVAVADVNADTTTYLNHMQLDLLVSVAGEYKIQTIVTYTENNATKYLTSIDTFVVGATTGEFKDVVVVSMGADSMIVNNEVVKLDVAPFIENNRTMLQYNVLYVFGIDVEWDGVNSVIAEGNGIKVVMTIGSKVAVVNGEKVTLDVAPYVVNGRTVVPVGFVTGTFGITPTFTYNADGSIADILFTAAK